MLSSCNQCQICPGPIGALQTSSRLRMPQIQQKNSRCVNCFFEGTPHSHLSLLKAELIPRPTLGKSHFRAKRNLAEAMKSTHPTAKSFQVFQKLVQRFSKEILHRNHNIRPNSREWSKFVEQVCSMVKDQVHIADLHNSCFCMIPSWQNTKISGRLSIMSTHCAQIGPGPLQQSART